MRILIDYFSLKNMTTQKVVTLAQLVFIGLVLFTPLAAHAQDYDIGTADGPFAAIVDFLQDIVDLLGGPIAKFILFVSLVVFVGAWIWAPASGAVGGFLRLLIGIVVIINAGAFLVSLGA